MNTSDNSYYELLNRLRYFADNHYLINSFTHGQEAELDISKRTLFPTMHVVPPVITRSNGNKLFAFEIIFADLPRMKEDKVENQMEVISDCDRIADDLVNEIKNGNTVFGRMVDLVGDAVTEPFTEDYANVLTGVTLRVTLAAPYTFNACDIPANWNSNDPTEPVYGSRELTMNIYDEGNFVVAAREMNFVGSGVTVTYDGNRAIVTITGGGGGGGGSVNSVTGNIVNNTDPDNPVVTQVQPDWNASSGLGQILNKPTIPSAQVNSDWDATSGVAQILNKPTSLPPSGSAGGDLTGSYPNPTVSKIHGIDVQNGTASDGQILKYHATENKWKHHTQVKADVGLGNVDNTSDANKPVSTAQQTALDLKLNKSDIWRHVITTDSAVGTGSSGVIKLASVEIPANTFGSGWDILVRSRIRRTSGSLAWSNHFYVNTSDSLSGATLVGIANSTTGIQVNQSKRDLVVKGATTETMRALTSVQTDDFASSVAFDNLSIDWTQTQYIIFAVNSGGINEQFVHSFGLVEGRKTIS